jgi:hypothetical protein
VMFSSFPFASVIIWLGALILLQAVQIMSVDGHPAIVSVIICRYFHERWPLRRAY